VSHRLAERRSLAYHRAIAARLTPEIVAHARANLDRAAAAATTDPRYLAAWRTLLERPLPDLAAALCADDELMRDLRQATPLAGVLSPRERWRLWREATGDAA
jgi:hypothetical protein